MKKKSYQKPFFKIFSPDEIFLGGQTQAYPVTLNFGPCYQEGNALPGLTEEVTIQNGHWSEACFGDPAAPGMIFSITCSETGAALYQLTLVSAVEGGGPNPEIGDCDNTLFIVTTSAEGMPSACTVSSFAFDDNILCP